MTVKELIEKLSTLDPDIRVFVCGYEGGYNDAGPIGDVKEIALNVNEEWYYGPHDDIDSHRIENKDVQTVQGIIL
jgi:hypothetical protein